MGDEKRFMLKKIKAFFQRISVSGDIYFIGSLLFLSGLFWGKRFFSNWELSTASIASLGIVWMLILTAVEFFYERLSWERKLRVKRGFITVICAAYAVLLVALLIKGLKEIDTPVGKGYVVISVVCLPLIGYDVWKRFAGGKTFMDLRTREEAQDKKKEEASDDDWGDYMSDDDWEEYTVYDELEQCQSDEEREAYLLDEKKHSRWWIETICPIALNFYGFENIIIVRELEDQKIDILAQKDGKRYAVKGVMFHMTMNRELIEETLKGKDFWECDAALMIMDLYADDDEVQLAQENGIELWDLAVCLKVDPSDTAPQ